MGISDIDPFVLNLAQGDPGQISPHVGAGAILVAASANNLVKAVYAVLYSNARVRAAPAGLALLAAYGVAAVAAF